MRNYLSQTISASQKHNDRITSASSAETWISSLRGEATTPKESPSVTPIKRASSLNRSTMLSTMISTPRSEISQYIPRPKSQQKER